MTPWDNPDSWLDVVDHLWFGAVAIMISIVPSWLSFRTRRDMAEVKLQVKNGHTVPLRNDVDDLIVTVDQIATSLSGLRRDLTDEERVRRDHINELRDDLDRRLNDLSRRLGGAA